MTKGFEISVKPERAFLIGVCSKKQSKEDYDYKMTELLQLSETAEIIVVKTFVQALDKPDVSTLVGKGKLEEIISLIETDQISTLIFNDNLSSSQARNIAQKTKCNVVDRTELILDIFAKHAKTHESILQVELAQLEYSYSKLRHLWQHFSRIAGGAVGVRGPGETQIEIDRRLVRERISMLKNKLLDIKKTTEIKRKKRSNQISICLVGYTNAGKSTLFNALTKEKIYTADKLFATLDSTTRALKMDSKVNVLLTDTIGFIENLPTTLIQSFYSTLYEVREADLLFHVVDVNNPKKDFYIQTVNKILNELNACDKDILLVFNKSDTQSQLQKKEINSLYPDSVFVSAKTGENIDILKEYINQYIFKRKVFKKYLIPANMENLISFLHNHTEIQSINYLPEQHHYECETMIDANIVKNIEEQLDKSRLINFIDSG